MVERYYNEDKSAIAVLVSYDYGAGWSTWANQKDDEEPYQIAYDKRVVEFWLEHKDDKLYLEELDRFNFEESPIKTEARAYFESLGYSDVYFGGFSDIQLEWVPIGARFEINEYDGAESLYILDLSDYAVA